MLQKLIIYCTALPSVLELTINQKRWILRQKEMAAAVVLCDCFLFV